MASVIMRRNHAGKPRRFAGGARRNDRRRWRRPTAGRCCENGEDTENRETGQHLSAALLEALGVTLKPFVISKVLSLPI